MRSALTEIFEKKSIYFGPPLIEYGLNNPVVTFKMKSIQHVELPFIKNAFGTLHEILLGAGIEIYPDINIEQQTNQVSSNFSYLDAFCKKQNVVRISDKQQRLCLNPPDT